MNAICTYKRPDAPGGETTGSQSCCHTRTKPAILINWALANWARVPNPPNCAAPGLRPNRRRGHAGNRRGSEAYHARSADRSRRVGPGRPAGCPRRTPGEARRRNLKFRLRAGLPRPSKNSGEGGYQGFCEWVQPGEDSGPPRQQPFFFSLSLRAKALSTRNAERHGTGHPNSHAAFDGQRECRMYHR